MSRSPASRCSFWKARCACGSAASRSRPTWPYEARSTRQLLCPPSFSSWVRYLSDRPSRRPAKAFWIAVIYSAVIRGFGKSGSRNHQHHRTALVSELHHRAISYAGRGEPLRAVSLTSRDRPGWPSDSAASEFIAFSIIHFDCSPFRSWTIAAKFSTTSATR